jgi:hypothetical protein
MVKVFCSQAFSRINAAQSLDKLKLFCQWKETIGNADFELKEENVERGLLQCELGKFGE